MPGTKDLLKRFKTNKYNLVSLPTISLPPEEADRFIDYVVDQSVWKQFARVERMAKPSKRIRQLGFGEGKMLYPADKFDESKYKKEWAHNLITLSSHKIRGCVVVFDDDLEEGLEGAAYKDHIMKIATAKISNELGYAYYIADTDTKHDAWCESDIESLWNGWRYRINHAQSGGSYYNSVSGASHIKEACICESGASCDDESPVAQFELAGGIVERFDTEPYDWEFKYAQMIKNMPSKYKQQNGLGQMVFINSDLVTQDFINSLINRGTGLGDAAIQGKVDKKYGQVPILDMPLMPSDLGSDLAYGTDSKETYGRVGEGEYTDVILTPKNNLIVGIQRDIKIESQRVPADEATYIFYSMKAALGIENVNAVVFTRCLTHKC